MDPSEDKVFLQALELEAWGFVFLGFCFVLSFFFSCMFVCGVCMCAHVGGSTCICGAVCAHARKTQG